MGNLIQFPNIDRSKIAEWEGGCPKCGGVDGLLNIGPDHFCVCHKHKAKWYRGSNLLSGWQQETEEDWQKNAVLLAGYREVEPIFPPRAGESVEV
ncbi:MAG: hypothetical protein LAP85_09640 [Acidobacteriia bacterium]|nr:hypothetical protein [Terriglobia bacterium]